MFAVLFAVVIALGVVLHGTTERVTALQQQATRAAKVVASTTRAITRLDGSMNAEQKATAKQELVLTSLGKPGTAKLGLCVNYSASGTDSNNDTYTYEDVNPATQQNGIVSCSSGQFVSVVPGPPSGGLSP